MKKIFTYTMMMLMAALTMTSCQLDEDATLAYDIEGVWQGSIDGNYYYNRYHSNAYDTEICFERRTAYSGTGYEVDYNLDTRRYTRNYFDWEIRNGSIYLDYDDNTTIVIRRDYEVYSVRGRLRFRGIFESYRTGEELASFNLFKVEDPNDYYDRYLSPAYTRSATPDSLAVAADSLQQK